MLNFFLLLLIVPLQLYSQTQGRIKLDQKLFNPNYPNSELIVSNTVWYKGNKLIQQVLNIDSKKDSTGVKTSIYTKYYLFIDPDLQQYFYYNSFSDTSKLIMHFKGEPPFEKYGGWDLYSNTKFDYDIYSKLADTIIDEKNYQRHAYRKIQNEITNDLILFTLCDLQVVKNIPIKYFKPFNEEFGCPILRTNSYSNGRLVGTTEFQYISETLTQEEKRIFEVWESNAKKKYKRKKLKYN